MLLPQVGTVIFGRYRLRREIARGGMSSVWEGDDRKLRRSVAVKILLSAAAKSRQAGARFEREAMAVAQLQSPHIVQIFDYGVDGECPFIVMELLEGEDLRSRLRRVKRMSLEELAPIVVQTAKGLGAAHAAGLVHRDLKPGNIFLVRSREEELVKLLDFGVAKATAGSDLEQETTKDGAILGTPRYMSPEQASGARAIDHRSDLWSLGVIAFRALTGRPPFAGKTPGDVLVRVCTQPAPRATDVAPDLPSLLDEFFHRALHRDPDERYQSARDFVRALFAGSPTSIPSLWPSAVSGTRPPVVMPSVRPKSLPPKPPPHHKAPAARASASEAPTDPGMGDVPVGREPDEMATIAMEPEILLETVAADDDGYLLLEPDEEDGDEPLPADEQPTVIEASPFDSEPSDDAAAAPRPAAVETPTDPSFVVPQHRGVASWVWLVAAGVALGLVVALLARRAPSDADGGATTSVDSEAARSAAVPVPPDGATLQLSATSPSDAPSAEPVETTDTMGASETTADTAATSARPADDLGEASAARSAEASPSAPASATPSSEPTSQPQATPAPTPTPIPPSPGDPFADRL